MAAVHTRINDIQKRFRNVCMFVGMPSETGITQEIDRIFTCLCILDYLTSFYDYFMLMRVWIF